MKTKETFLMVTITVLLSGFLSACDSWLGVNITKDAQLKKMKNKMIQFVKPDVFVHEIRLTSADERAKDIMGHMVITYTDVSDKNRLKEITLDVCTWKVIREKEIKTAGREVYFSNKYGSEKNFVRISALDVTKIASVCKQAMTQIEEKDMKYAGIEYFSICYQGKQPIYEFLMHGRPKGSGVTSKGRFSGIYYYDVFVKTDQNGQFNIRVGEKLKVKRADLI